MVKIVNISRAWIENSVVHADLGKTGIITIPPYEDRLSRVAIGVFYVDWKDGTPDNEGFWATSGFIEDGNDPLIKLGYLAVETGYLKDGVLFETEDEGFTWFPRGWYDGGYQKWIAESRKMLEKDYRLPMIDIYNELKSDAERN